MTKTPQSLRRYPLLEMWGWSDGKLWKAGQFHLSDVLCDNEDLQQAPDEQKSKGIITLNMYGVVWLNQAFSCAQSHLSHHQTSEANKCKEKI